MSIPKTKELQKEVLAIPPEGHTVALGTAGSRNLKSWFLRKGKWRLN